MARNGNIKVRLKLQPPGESAASRLLCVWGYSDYDKQGVADAYHRLEFRPFATSLAGGDEAQMVRSLDRRRIGAAAEVFRRPATCRRSDQKGPRFLGRPALAGADQNADPRFDNVVNHVAAQSRVIFEYPGFMHGLGYAKYGKINHGYYGFEAAGMHDEWPIR